MLKKEQEDTQKISYVLSDESKEEVARVTKLVQNYLHAGLEIGLEIDGDDFVKKVGDKLDEIVKKLNGENEKDRVFWRSVTYMLTASMLCNMVD